MPGDTPFDAALAALDVEPTHHPDRMVTTYDILGLDAVRAAHCAEVERAVADKEEAEGANILNRNAVRALSARVAKLEAEQREARNRAARLEAALRGLLHEDGALNGDSATDTPAEAAARAALEDKP